MPLSSLYFLDVYDLRFALLLGLIVGLYHSHRNGRCRCCCRCRRNHRRRCCARVSGDCRRRRRRCCRRRIRYRLPLPSSCGKSYETFLSGTLMNLIGKLDCLPLASIFNQV
jgi:hypothetical protein